MRLWLIPMKYVAIGALGAIALPRIEYQFLASPAFALSTSSAQATLSAAAHLVPHARSLYRHVHLQPVDAGLGRPGRDRTGADVLRDAGRRARGGEYGTIFAASRSLERPADFERS